MSVRKRKWITRSGEAKEAWIVDYVDQQGGRHIETFDRKKDADEYHAKVKVDVRTGTHTPVSKSITVAQAAEDWITSIKLEGREASTLAQYRQHAHHIGERIGNLKLASLTTPLINSFRDDLLATMSRPMARKVLSSLKSLLRDAQRRGNVAQNVALGVKSIDADKRDEGKLKVGVDIPTADEIKASSRAGRWRPFLITAIFTGLRAIRLRGLRWDDVDLKSASCTCASAQTATTSWRAEVEGRRPHRATGADRAQRAARMEACLPEGRAPPRVPDRQRAHRQPQQHRRALKAAVRAAGLMKRRATRSTPGCTRCGIFMRRGASTRWIVAGRDCRPRSCSRGSGTRRS